MIPGKKRECNVRGTALSRGCLKNWPYRKFPANAYLYKRSGTSIYRNPFHHQLIIDHQYKKNIQLMIVDKLGRSIIQKKLTQPKNTIRIPGHHGFLVIALTDHHGQMIRRAKVIKQ